MLFRSIGEEGPLNRCPENPTVGGQKPAGAVLPPGLAVLPPHTIQPANGTQKCPQQRYCRQRRRYYRWGATEGQKGGSAGGTAQPRRGLKNPQQRYYRQRRRYCRWEQTEGSFGGTSGGTTGGTASSRRSTGTATAVPPPEAAVLPLVRNRRHVWRHQWRYYCCSATPRERKSTGGGSTTAGSGGTTAPWNRESCRA